MSTKGEALQSTGSERDEGSNDKACGMVRPIAEMGTYSAAHWQDVHNIVEEAAKDAGFKLRLVSENEAVGIIISDIVRNLYFDPIVICDVSGRNPNVMFELGMRVAFEKPVVVITDDETPFSFDISPIKHIQYPRSLRFPLINEFKARITNAIVATLETTGDQGQRGYLQQFGPIEVTHLGSQNLDLEDIASSVLEMRRTLSQIAVNVSGAPASLATATPGSRIRWAYELSVQVSYSKRESIVSKITPLHGVIDVHSIDLFGRSRIDVAFGGADVDDRKAVIAAVLSEDKTAKFDAHTDSAEEAMKSFFKSA
jgi:hypothetical protein